MVYNPKGAAALTDISGSMSGFDSYSTEPAETLVTTERSRYTVVEFLEALRNMTDTFDPDKLFELEEMIQKHIARKDNPHQLSLEDVGLSVIDSLYQIWIAAGNTGTVEDLITILFENYDIATIADIQTPEGKKQIVNGEVLAAYLDLHNQDLTAHEKMWDHHLPGKPKMDQPIIDLYPVHAHLSMFGWSHLLDTVSSISVMASTGRLQVQSTSQKGLLDYSRGKPEFLVCAHENVNLLAPSIPARALDIQVIGGERTVSPNSIYMGQTSSANLFTEITEVGEHGVQLVPMTLIESQAYTISVYMAPEQRREFEFSHNDGAVHRLVLKEVDGVFTVTSEEGVSFTQIDDYGFDTTGYIRVSYGFVAYTSTTARVQILSLVDGEASYEGTNGVRGFVFDAYQLSYGSMVTPHIFNTTDAPMLTHPFLLRGYPDTSLDYSAGSLMIRSEPIPPEARPVIKFLGITYRTESDGSGTITYRGYRVLNNSPIPTNPIYTELLSINRPEFGEGKIAISWDRTFLRIAAPNYTDTILLAPFGSSAYPESTATNRYVQFASSHDVVDGAGGMVQIEEFAIYNTASTIDELKFLLGV